MQKQKTKEAKLLPVNWNIEELVAFFESATPPEPPIVLNPVCVITNVPGYIKYHLEIVKANNGKEAYLPYLNRLNQLKDIITKQRQ